MNSKFVNGKSGRPDLNLLLAFDALMQTRNVTRAARTLGLSQPAMSNALSRLRSQFGDRLFERGAGAMIPTPRAMEAHASMKESLAVIQSVLENTGSFDPASDARQFRIAMAEDPAFFILPGLVGRIVRDTRQIEVKVLSTSHISGAEQVLSGDAEAAIGIAPKKASKELRCKPLFRERLVCIGRKGHQAFSTGAKALSIRDFLAGPHVVVRPSVHQPSQVDLALAKAGKRRRSVVEVAHVLLVPYLIQDTDMIACFPERLARHFCPRLGLELREPPFALHAYQGSLIWHRRFDQDGGHAWLRERIEALCTEESASGLKGDLPAAKIKLRHA
jgi:DNA-binding transcriptional LysR family regulator